MRIDDKIRDKKLWYDINRESAKISALPFRKIYKYEYITSEEILPFDQNIIIEQAKFAYSHLGKPLQKQRKTIDSQGKKQIKPIEDHGKQLILNKIKK